MTNYFKASLKSGNIKKPLMRELIMGLGQRYNRWNVIITRSFSGMGSIDYIKPLSDEKALDSGAEFIGEVIAYGTLLIWGIYEVNKLGKDTKAKEAKLNESIQNLGDQVKNISEEYLVLAKKVNELREELEKQQTKVENEPTDSTETSITSQ
jgi:hypothetical protein